MRKFIVVSSFLSVVISCSPEVTQMCDQECKNRPNILFAISDDQSFVHTSFEGSNWINTPAFEYVAKTGIYFENCYATSPGCAPSRGSIVTGRYPWQNEQAGQHASSWPSKYISFVDQLSKSGYTVGMTGKGVDPFQYGEPFRLQNAAGPQWNNLILNQPTTGISDISYIENFKNFVTNRTSERPFFFWFGASEPHRPFEEGSWKRMGKSISEAEVPGFLPDTEEIRGDLLDYAVEIEWFDSQLQEMLDYLDLIGELENTIVIVTSDNGMPFPLAKANAYEFGVHVPMAISWPGKFPGGRRINDFISFIDLAPTILELAKAGNEDMMPISGKSFAEMLSSESSSGFSSHRTFAMSGRERHSSARYLDYGYPQRAIHKEDFLLVWNIKPDRWPAGDPQSIDQQGQLHPLYGISANGVHNSDWAFCDIDGGPTKSFLVEKYNNEAVWPFFKKAVAKRPEYELFSILNDPYCVNNLSEVEEYQGIFNELKQLMFEQLKVTKDPRVVGPDKEIFESYERYFRIRYFPQSPTSNGNDSLNALMK